MKKKYILNYFQYFFIWFSFAFFVFLMGTIYLTTTSIRAIYQFVVFNKKPIDDFIIILISFVPMWNIIYIVWREFRFPVIWLSDSGITALTIAIVPIKTHVLWENTLSVTDKKTLKGTLFDYGTSVSVKPLGKTQQRVFKLSGGNEIFISSKMSKYDELVELLRNGI